MKTFRTFVYLAIVLIATYLSITNQISFFEWSVIYFLDEIATSCL